ncbi:MAG: HAD-IA family hydrolase [Parvibaculaceae bacterium]
MSDVNVQAVIWDFGGVLTSSPFEAFNRFEAERGLPKDFIRTINATNPDTNAWALFERSEISLDAFDRQFAEEAEALGGAVTGREVVELLAGDIRPAMVTALKKCKEHFKVGCITNNVSAGEGAGMARSHDKATAVAEVMALFDHVIESSKIGIRKPDPRIYEMACEALGVDPSRSVYLDDLGINLKPARALGMTTIKVLNGDQGLADLEAAVGMPLK